MTLSDPPAHGGPLKPGDFAALLDWWRGAGVDQEFADAPRDWLAPLSPAASASPAAAPPPSPAPRAAAPIALIGGPAAGWPTDLAAFSAWWQNEPSLDGGQVFARVPPRGASGAPLMVLVDHPEASDSESLLSGSQGKLIRAILLAIGIEPEQAYFASVLPRHMPLPDWAALAAAGIGQLTAHHVALAAPQRLISFGKHVSSLLGHDPAKSVDPAGPFYRVASGVPALAAPELTTLMARPRGKADLWRALLDWQDT